MRAATSVPVHTILAELVLLAGYVAVPHCFTGSPPNLCKHPREQETTLPSRVYTYKGLTRRILLSHQVALAVAKPPGNETEGNSMKSGGTITSNMNGYKPYQ